MFLVTVLKSTPFFGDQSTLRSFESVAEKSKLPEVREAATAILPALRERVQKMKEVLNVGLLIPSSAPSLRNEELLRPAKHEGETPVAELLRPAETIKISHESELTTPLFTSIKPVVYDKVEEVQKLEG